MLPDNLDLSNQKAEQAILSTDQASSITLPQKTLDKLKSHPNKLTTKPFQSFFENTYLIDSNILQHNTIIKSQNGRMMMPVGTIIYANSSTTPSKNRYLIAPPPEELQGRRYSGYLIQPNGEAKWLKNKGNVSILKITKTQSEITKGNWLIPAHLINKKTPEEIYKLKQLIKGKVIGSTDTQINSAESHSVVINRGTSDRLKSGALVYFYTNTETSKDSNGNTVDIPGHLIGEGVIYRVSTSMSIALVLDSTEEIEKGTVISTHEYK